MSYVQKVHLGGKSYAPTNEHPFNPYFKELSEFVDLMSKLQTKIEDEPTPEEALQKILNILRTNLLKALVKQSIVDQTTAGLLTKLSFCSSRWSSRNKMSDNASPAAKGSMAGQKNVKILRCLVDYLTAKPLATNNASEILGKIRNSGADEGRTPIPMPALVSLFRSPGFTSPTTLPTTKSRLAEKTAVMEASTPKAVKRGRPKFEATLAWAAETSPLVLKSSEKQILTEGVTLAVKAEGTEAPQISEVILAGKRIAEEALEEARNAVKPKRATTSKRTILTDLKNVEKWSKLADEGEKSPNQRNPRMNRLPRSPRLTLRVRRMLRSQQSRLRKSPRRRRSLL